MSLDQDPFPFLWHYPDPIAATGGDHFESGRSTPRLQPRAWIGTLTREEKKDRDKDKTVVEVCYYELLLSSRKLKLPTESRGNKKSLVYIRST
jgi:hypothetical protein